MHNSLDERSLGAVPVGVFPADGHDLRAGETFEALQSQIDRLNDIHASTPIEWPVVIQLASKILREEGKDLACGAWLALGLFHKRGLPGLADGIHVLRDLVEGFWDDMLPPVTRLRGRRNQMQWLLDQLGDLLDEQAMAQMPELDEALHAQMLLDWDVLDEQWQSHDDQAPAFYGMAAVLRRLPVKVAEQQAVPAAQADAAQAPIEQPESATAAGPQAPVAAVAPSVHRPPEVAAQLAMPASAEQVGEAVEQALAGLQPLIDWLIQEQPTAPILFRLNRICAWTTLERAPLAEGQRTRLPPPAEQLADSFARIVQTGEPEAVLRFAESRLSSFPCWLDLSRASHHALLQMGDHR